jgi:hypothetical protein
MKRIVIVSILAGVLLIPLVPGCGLFWHESPPAEPITVELSFPDDAPQLNTEAELNCVIKAPAISLKNMNVEIRLPEAFELVSGDLSWVGDINQGDEVEVISAVVRAIKIGNWAIELRTSINPEKQGGFSWYPDWRDAIYVSIFEDSAEWGIYPPWYKGHGHEVKISMEGDPLQEIKSYISISHAPLLNETAELIYTVSSRIDFPNIEAQIILPEGAVLVDGNLEWQGDLEAGVPINILAKIAFKETGNWRIDAGVWYWIGDENSGRVMDSIYLTVGVNHSEFGEPPEEDMSARPPPPPISLDG